jgi:hypothetical protein
MPMTRDVFSPRKLSSRHHIYFSPIKLAPPLPLLPPSSPSTLSHTTKSSLSMATSPLMSPFTSKLYSFGEPSFRQQDLADVSHFNSDIQSPSYTTTNRRSSKRLVFSQMVEHASSGSEEAHPK